MNHLLDCRQLHNRFLVMRHGESEANRRALIISTPAAGISGYGLTQRGRNQVLASITANTQLDAATLIYSSDFKRALETAQIVHHRLGCRYPITIHAALRERCFGDLEGADHRNYEQVWQADAKNADHSGHHVEAANAVMARVTALVCELDRSHRSHTFLLVAHGDVLQLLQTAFHRQPAERHRSLTHLDTAEIRPLILS
jgi:probable phosphoglycerate mutase